METALALLLIAGLFYWGWAKRQDQKYDLKLRTDLDADVRREATAAARESMATQQVLARAETYTRPAPPPRPEIDPAIIEHATFPLAGTKDHREACLHVDIRTPVLITPSEKATGSYDVAIKEVGNIGAITARHPVAKALAEGQAVLHATVNSVDHTGPKGPTVRLRVVTGPEGASYNMPGARSYMIPLVGEQHYQSAIRTLDGGHELVIVHEPDNPYDAKALAVRTMDDRTIGYLTRDCFIRELVHDEGKGCKAIVASIEEDRRGEGFLHVTISAEKCPGPVEVRAYRAA